MECAVCEGLHDEARHDRFISGAVERLTGAGTRCERRGDYIAFLRGKPADLYDEVYAVLRGMQEEEATADMLLGSTPYYAEVDFSCGGVEVEEPRYLTTNDPMPQEFSGCWINPKAVWGTIDTPDLMSAVRDIARGS